MKKEVPIYVHILRMLALLCALLFLNTITQGQSVKFGNSYINISKKTVGGTVQPGDTLEIRTNIWFPNAYNSNNIYFARYIDNMPTNTAFADDSLRLITNEGLLYKRWSLSSGNDPGTYLASPPVGEYNVKITLGKNATAPTNNSNSPNGGGTIVTGGTAKDKPRAGGNVLITTSFRVKVTGAIGDTIVLGAGQIRYKKLNSINTADTVVNVIQYKILISNNDPICPNSIGRNFVAEAGGTFDSGTVQNRAYAPTFAIPTYTYLNLTSSQAIGDGTYAIVNNLSPWASTYQNAEKRNNCVTSTSGSPPPPQSCANRMFSGHWDIIGDHTGTLNSIGNAPVAQGTRGGYMLVVNADYATSEAYRQAIKGLCPNTTYEFSLWVKNVCTNCGADSSNNQTFKPGVYPNLSFAIDGLDRYSSGQIDTIGWMKKGFLFKTGPTQDSITISIRNNASGGGGNDWAIDDIALVTCNPLLNLIPSGDAQVCYNSQVDISSTVNSFFNNYTYYRFERSVDNGATWSVPGTGTGSPAQVSGGYEYTAQLVPSFLADSAHHLNQYRFVVASSPQNLGDPNCSFTASTRIVVMVNNCSIILSALDSSTRLRREITRTGKNVEIRRLINPVTSKVSFDLITVGDGLATITLIDSYGRIVRDLKGNVFKGYNHVILDQINQFGSGTYYLRVNVNGETLHRKIMKF